MIGIWQQYANQYLYVVAIGTLVLFGLPMMLQPLRWARVLGWQLPEHTHLAIYFGRCLGAIICVLAYFALQSCTNEITRRFFFQILIASCVMMIAVHIYGAIKKIQPLLESLEIAYWSAIVFISLLFYPA